MEFNLRHNVGVGAYIRNSINFKHRKDIENFQPDLEHLWVEIPGRNRHSKAFVGVMYRSTRILSNSDWLERLETLLGHLTANWDGLLILTGDMNIDMLQPANSLTIQYQATLDVLGLQQMLKQPTRNTKTSKTLLDHVVTNYPYRITNTGVIRCSIVSDHDGIFACANVRVPRFQLRYKYIRNEKCFDENAFKHDFSTLTLSIVYAVKSPNEMVDLLNTLIVECLHRHAHLNRVKIARPLVPWLHAADIRRLQAERDKLRLDAHIANDDESWAAFRAIRNKIKVVIGKAKRSFFMTALSSKRPKEVWRVIHRVLSTLIPVP